MKFSERMGYTRVRDSLQIESIDGRLEMKLWNAVVSYFFNCIRDTQTYRKPWEGIWADFFNQELDKIPKSSLLISSYQIVDYCNQWFFSSQWHEKYDFVEYLLHNTITQTILFEYKIKEILKAEHSGYTIIDCNIVPITSEEEIVTIEEALVSTQNKWSPVNTHIKTALVLLSDRENPDYRNSVKESISAVEAMCKIITKNNTATLGQALNEIEKKYQLHGALKTAFRNLYGYTSDSDGIRHSLLTDSVDITMEDAKFMLVSCSAFINYLKAKCS